MTSALIPRRQILTGIAASLIATTIPMPVLASMRSYRWKNRPLLVFAPHRDHAAFKRQQKLLGGRGASLRDRNMIVIFVVGENVSARYGAAPQQSAAALRRQYSVSGKEFAVLLVGKDTGIKRRSGQPVAMETLFRQIDQMPMRRQEMRRKKKSSS